MKKHLSPLSLIPIYLPAHIYLLFSKVNYKYTRISTQGNGYTIRS